MPYIKITEEGYEIKPIISNRWLGVFAIFVLEFGLFLSIVDRVWLK